jgi:hypothetical protein
MKRSIVPAQITTVEDRVLGNLTPYQAGLISLPLIFGVLFYVTLPPHFHLKLYKLCLIVGLELTGAILSIRKNDQMLIFWLIMRLRYNLRPRFYVYDKNDSFLRDTSTDSTNMPAKRTEKKVVTAPLNVPQIGLGDAVRVEEIMSDERVNLRFNTTRKGRMHVVANEIK